MKTLSLLLIAISFICIFFSLDYKLGRKKHLATAKQYTFPLRKSNLQIFTHGKSLFSDYFSELKKAKKHIHVMFYICSNDCFSKEFLAILKEKAQAGVEVRLLLDWAGSRKVNKKMIESLKKAQVAFAFANTPRAPYFFHSAQMRNHRKITVIDGKIGYMGGYNVGNEYIDLHPKLSPWRDYHLKITGEGAADLQTIFLADWEKAAKVKIVHNDYFYPPLDEGDSLQKFVPTDGIFLEDFFSELIQKANKSISIGSPYFIPSERIFHDLLQALKRKVKLTILVPYEADHLLVQETSYPFLKKLIQHGAKVYQYKKGFYHAKVLIIDGEFCDLGTANFDNRSFFINHEINCFIYDKQFVEKVIDIFNKDISDSRKLLLKDMDSLSLWKKIKVWIGTTIQHFL